MLSTLVLFAAVSSPSLPSQVVRRGEDFYESQRFHQHTETITDPNDPSKTVQADVSYSFGFEVRYNEFEDADYVHYRTVWTRPESPARPFQMSQMRIGVEDNPENAEDLRDLARDLEREGIPISNAPVYHRALEAMRRITVEGVDPRPINIDPNEGIRAGGWTRRDYGYEFYYTDLRIGLLKHIRIPGREGTITTPVAEPIYYNLFEYWIPIPLADEKFYPDPGNSMSASYALPDGIGGLTFTPEYRTLLGTAGVSIPRIKTDIRLLGSDKGVTTNATQYANDIFETLPRSRSEILDIVRLTPNKMYDMLNGTAAQGQDMNSLTVPGDLNLLGQPTCGSEITMPSGTVWVPDTPGYQVMTNTVPLRYQFSFEASVGGGIPMFATARTHCLNMSLKEPAAGIRYFPYMPNDEVLRALADLTNKSNFRGPWDQVRTWIYTDKVTLSEANKRIFPPVTEGQYGNGLFDVFRLGGLTKDDLANKKLFEPRLLASAGTLEPALKWLAMHMGEKFGPDVRAWLEGSPKELTDMVNSPRSEYETAHVPKLFTSLLKSVNKDTRMGALTFLDKLSGGESKLKGKVGNFHASLYSDDPKEVDLAKAVTVRYAGSER